MKQIIIFLFAMMPVWASAEEKQDTTFLVNNRQIVVKDSVDRVHIDVFDKDGNQLSKAYETEFVDGQQVERIYVGSPFLPKPRNGKFVATLPAIFLGTHGMSTSAWNNSNKDALHLDRSRSWQIGVTPIDLLQPLNKRNTLGLQYGLQFWVTYQHLDRDFTLNAPGVYVPYSGESMHKNYLKWSTISIPVLLDYQLQNRKHSFYFGGGLSLEYRYSLKSKYEVKVENHGHYSVRQKVPMNPWGVNLEYHIGYGAFQFYTRAALTPFIKLADGTHTYPYAMGLGITF